MQNALLRMQQVVWWLRRNPKIAFVLIAVTVVLTRCHHSTAETSLHARVVTVESRPVVNSLFYSGMIQPLQAVAVLSPTDGVIEEMSFHYGDTVTAGELLFTVNSEKFQTEYKNALVQYVKARSDLSAGKNQLAQGVFLHTNKLISDDELKSRQTNFYNVQLAFVQAKDVLAKMLKQLNITDVNLFDLSINDIGKINAALHMQGDEQRLKISSPSAGVALLPAKIEGGADKKLGKGEQVKQGDVLALIGDGQGVSVHINVNEYDINQIKVGQPVKITGAAFPDYVLSGVVAGVDHQAQVNQNGMPNFSAEVVVAKLTPAQKKEIFMGMSAKVEIDVEESAQMAIPIAAVTEKNGNAYVQRQDAKSGRLHETLVHTGKTTADSVIIVDGLQVGDKVVTVN